MRVSSYRKAAWSEKQEAAVHSHEGKTGQLGFSPGGCMNLTSLREKIVCNSAATALWVWQVDLLLVSPCLLSLQEALDPHRFHQLPARTKRMHLYFRCIWISFEETSVHSLVWIMVLSQHSNRATGLPVAEVESPTCTVSKSVRRFKDKRHISPDRYCSSDHVLKLLQEVPLKRRYCILRTSFWYASAYTK